MVKQMKSKQCLNTNNKILECKIKQKLKIKVKVN